MNNTETLKERLIEGYNDKMEGKPCKDWFSTYLEKLAYLLGHSKASSREVITEENIEELIQNL